MLSHSPLPMGTHSRAKEGCMSLIINNGISHMTILLPMLQTFYISSQLETWSLFNAYNMWDKVECISWHDVHNVKFNPSLMSQLESFQLFKKLQCFKERKSQIIFFIAFPQKEYPILIKNSSSPNPKSKEQFQNSLVCTASLWACTKGSRFPTFF